MRLSARLVILYNWNVIGWQRGIIQRRVYDGRIKRTNMQCNFYLWYEVDDEEESADGTAPRRVRRR